MDFSQLTLYSMSADPPGPPSAPTAQDVCKDSCELTWRPPENDGGSPVTGYHVERSASGRTDRWIRITRQPVPDTRYKVTELVEGNEYQFRISAENSVGTGPPGPESDSILAKDPWGQYPAHFSVSGLLVLQNDDDDDVSAFTATSVSVREVISAM